MFIRQVLLLIYFCGLYSVAAQKKSFHTGYIIEQNGDTIHGLIKDRSPEPFVTLYPKVRFRKAGSWRTKRYGPNAILGYGYEDQNFVSMPFREESTFFKFRYYTDASAPSTFLKVIQRSEELIYFERLFVHDDSSYVDFIPFFYRPGSSELVRVTQGILGFKRKRLATYFSNCPALLKELHSNTPTIESVPALYGFFLAHCIQ